jgi:hypothetical protein
MPADSRPARGFDAVLCNICTVKKVSCEDFVGSEERKQRKNVAASALSYVGLTGST